MVLYNTCPAYCGCPMPGSKGFIRVRSATGEDALPVANVAIELIRQDVKSTVYNRSFNTGADGLSANIEVICPARALSLDENNTTVLPYSVYDLTAVAEGYGTVFIEGIQAFAGEVAMVELELIPSQNPLVSLGDEVYLIPPHGLFAGNNGTGRGPVVACVPPRVLQEVVIPDRITVHLGKPTANARNVTVSFRDYIKNVASSEVYPTWVGSTKPACVFC